MVEASRYVIYSDNYLTVTCWKTIVDNQMKGLVIRVKFTGRDKSNLVITWRRKKFEAIFGRENHPRTKNGILLSFCNYWYMLCIVKDVIVYSLNLV